MEIIEQGNNHKRKVDTECRNCGSKLREEEKNLRWEHNPREQSGIARETCPVCGEQVFFYK